MSGVCSGSGLMDQGRPPVRLIEGVHPAHVANIKCSSAIDESSGKSPAKVLVLPNGIHRRTPRPASDTTLHTI